jgi:hypothetical protein
LKDKRNELIRAKRLKRFRLEQQKETQKKARKQALQRTNRYSEDVWPQLTTPRLTSRGRAVVIIPKVFSFIDDPVSTIETLNSLSSAVRDRNVHYVFIDFSKCQTLDLCASTAMTIIVLRAKRSRSGKAFGFQGNYPSTERAKILLRSSGLLKYLKTNAPILPSEIASQLKLMELRSGHSTRPERSAKCDQATTQLVAYVDNCLKESGAQLTAHGKSWLGTLIGETIANAEEHAKGHWYATAHFDRLEPDVQEGGACHIVLMNFGRTIFDSFYLPDSNPVTLAKLQALSDIHRKRRFFDIRNRAYDEKALYTLYALQEGVSRVSAERGIGTTLLINFFMELSAVNAKMCVLSGTSVILFDGKYSLKPERFDGGHRRVIAFNESNSLEERPDDKNVWTIRDGFPGTVISLRFNLKKDYVDFSTESVSICQNT